MKASVAEVARVAPDVIVAATNSAAAELARLTSTLPVVFTRVADPVGSGFVASIARPAATSPASKRPTLRWEAMDRRLKRPAAISSVRP